MTNSYIPAQTGFTRVFVIEGRARSNHRPNYEHALKMMALDQSFGDVENIYSPDPDEYGAFQVLGSVRAEEERPTTSLMGRYAADLRSELLRLAKIGCEFDVQLHIGQCTDPSDFNEFKKALIFEAALIPSFSTEDLGALQPDEKAAINETADISAIRFYEVVQVGAAERAGDIVTNEVIDVVICDAVSCGECEELSDGCQKIFAVTLAAGGSPGTPADVVFSIDGGVNFYAHDIDTLGVAEDPTGIACLGRYILVISNDSCSHHYALKSEFDTVQDPAFTEVTAGYNPSGCPNDIWSLGTFAFIVGDNGYVYILEDGTQAPTVVDAGVAVADDLLAVHALSEDFAVAVGENGAVVFTESQTLWQATSSRPVGIGVDLQAVAVRDEGEWLVGTDDGRLFVTYDQGVTWSELSYPGSGAGAVWDIAIASDSVLYMATATADPQGRILRSYNGAYDWNIIPEGVGVIPANDRIRAIAACKFDVNFAVGVGLADDAADGIIVVAED